jgi:hypothetical protein
MLVPHMPTNTECFIDGPLGCRLLVGLGGHISLDGAVTREWVLWRPQQGGENVTLHQRTANLPTPESKPSPKDPTRQFGSFSSQGHLPAPAQ